jgi:2,5-diketo-D-gluconate reductase A
VHPAVNQIELHPYLTQDELRAFDAEHDIVTEAWSPIAQGLVLNDPTIAELAKAHGRTPAQIVLRWHIQLGNVVFPKSTNPQRMKENFEIFDFELSETDLGMISALNRNERTGPDPDVFDYVPS